MDGELPQPAFHDNNIVIVFTIDNLYAKYFSVCLQSILQNSSSELNYDICVIVNELNDSNKNKLLQQLADYKNFSLRFVYLKGTKFLEIVQKWWKAECFERNKRFTSEVYFILFIPLIFKNYEKVLYLDADILVRQDIAKLFSIDLQDNYAGGVLDLWDWNLNTALPPPCEHITHGDYLRDYIGIENKSTYINSGVCLFNIKQITEEHYENSLIYTKSNNSNFLVVDQCVINSAYKKRIMLLDPKWNAVPTLFRPEKLRCIDIDTARSTIQDPHIFHFATGIAQVAGDTVFAREWRDTAENTPFARRIFSEINLMQSAAIMKHISALSKYTKKEFSKIENEIIKICNESGNIIIPE